MVCVKSAVCTSPLLRQLDEPDGVPFPIQCPLEAGVYTHTHTYIIYIEQ